MAANRPVSNSLARELKRESRLYAILELCERGDIIAS